MAIGGVNVLVAFFAGVVSCLSPCVLPLAPIYFSSLVGGTAEMATPQRRRDPLLHSAAFMAGFILLFTGLGASVGLVGFALRDQLPVVEKIGGCF